ncbi:bifunctional phosphopantothenoylcysteine decarboxylase/phosphopantothenate--cysteine ligase CoaBC [Veillonella caviae]|uniref:bifunctional phosphopantothenoylcysteine decarboxylase/phosphopantothenate--cysteine ligase CoaBC n=1 Tax=Veillonella caviae TaxID=248316 RepID=UPI0023F2272E|nr:bifunctional phosphopantothenoylcysteine decarboxylase/phosphopantothenate--cysteine ligase CoaBC [Veillonella caviae]MCF0157379.1 bifunctional phosphopantothenoylcysteine decarboxylase/phosphopantothenate--cysteine ligase CoaBC [Veillonella sp.]MCI6407749.1 bifunctional phosphopantothenoylcysteine decarboxylase/phosphopantothenate--cysteine ligase CoaBC [Veillonella caviae]MCI7693431.1 bifunctional phosphopantothenoylcysteine decarboxylase/phosphopantothenate--cysteine ligase CoaBC [Veillone
MRGKHIIVGVSAGIAAYKAIEVVSRLRKAGAEVKVVMTKNATHIATPLTFGEISNHPVAIDMWEEIHDWNVEHIALATWADAYIVVPATANVIGKINAGIADDMLTTTIMATPAPKFLCPAMNTEMYNNPIVQRNLADLRSLGYHIMEPEVGWLACGVTGPGRLPSPESIVQWLTEQLSSLENKHLLDGKTVVVTAGGTQEYIDPVRYIGNRSSGKMGYAIAAEAARQGARVILVSAPTSLSVPANVELVAVDSAQSMKEAVDRLYDSVDIVIMAAAVSDFRVANKAEQKIKKMESMTLELVKNPDILQSLGERKTHQLLVGFAAETEHVVEYGQDKVKRKHLDMLVANDVSKANAGFNVDTNEGYFLYPNREPKVMQNMKKSELARHIIREISDLLSFKS